MIRMISTEERMSVTYEQRYLVLFVSNDRTNLSVCSNVNATIVISRSAVHLSGVPALCFDWLMRQFRRKTFVTPGCRICTFLVGQIQSFVVPSKHASQPSPTRGFNLLPIITGLVVSRFNCQDLAGMHYIFRSSDRISWAVSAKRLTSPLNLYRR